jgi:putative AdoMet-dependent methyltransferase
MVISQATEYRKKYGKMALKKSLVELLNKIGMTISFNRWASTYDSDVARASHTDFWMFGGYDRVLDKVVEYCRLAENSYTSVLDIGIGTGNLAARFASRGLQVTGIDPSAKMRRICRKKFPGIKVMAGDFLKYPRSLPQFDLIISAYSFHHLTAMEKARAVPLMKKLLKPGGRIIIADFMFQNYIEMGRTNKSIRETHNADMVDTFKDEYPGLYDDLKRVLEKEGFKVDGEQLTVSVWIIRACL